MMFHCEVNTPFSSIISDEITLRRVRFHRCSTVGGMKTGCTPGRTPLAVDHLYPVSRSPRFHTKNHRRRRFDAYKTGHNVSALPPSPQMSSHSRPTTPPQDPKKLQAHLESQQSTRPNRGSSASGQLLVKVQCVHELP
jgi:hypothetical protein